MNVPEEHRRGKSGPEGRAGLRALIVLAGLFVCSRVPVCLPAEISQAGNPYLFHGARYDGETGFYYFRNRYYDPRAGRFLQRDPVWDEQNVGGWYTFVGNSPVSEDDAFGLDGKSGGSAFGRAAEERRARLRAGQAAAAQARKERIEQVRQAQAARRAAGAAPRPPLSLEQMERELAERTAAAEVELEKFEAELEAPEASGEEICPTCPSDAGFAGDEDDEDWRTGWFRSKQVREEMEARKQAREKAQQERATAFKQRQAERRARIQAEQQERRQRWEQRQAERRAGIRAEREARRERWEQRQREYRHGPRERQIERRLASITSELERLKGLSPGRAGERGTRLLGEVVELQNELAEVRSQLRR
jgi:RHS repeat-associated protein